MKYHTLFLSKTRKDVAKFVLCCSCDWRLRVKLHVSILSASLIEIRFWQNDRLLALVHIIRGYLYLKVSFGYMIIGYTVGN